MEKRIVAVSIDKVQTLLFEVIHSHAQEKQTENATLKNVMRTSHDISTDFHRKIKEVFNVEDKDELISCSGVLIFSCSLPVDEIEKRLSDLYIQYYCESQGQKMVKFVHFRPQSEDDVKNIEKAKQQLKKSKCMNSIVAKNAAILFSPQPINKPAEEKKDDKESNSLFVKDLNALRFSGINKETESDSWVKAEAQNRFRIAVIKADLDGMGNMFESIDDLKIYQEMSKELNRLVSLNGLHKAAGSAWKEQSNPWIFPLYVAGDDIFFAVSVANLFKGIDVCRELLNRVNANLKDKGISATLHCSMSIGVDITFNRQPLRYYAEMVEDQLKNAKDSKCKALKAFLRTKISIGGLTFFDIDLKMKNEKKAEWEKEDKRKADDIRMEEAENPIWQYFISDIKRLQRMRSLKNCKEKIGTTHFLYSLLEKITNPIEKKDQDAWYFNQVLYHLLPKYIESADQELRDFELQFNTAIMKQLYRKGPDNKGDKIVLCDYTKHRLEVYIRLLLLFSDDRFSPSFLISDEGKGSHEEEKNNGADEKNIRKFLQKPLNYLVSNYLHGPLSDCFIGKSSYAIKRGKRDIQIPCYKRLKIEKSMFFKLRDTERVTLEKAANMIALQNPKPSDEIDAMNAQREKDGKAPYHLYFDRKKFLKTANSRNWTPCYIDSLMLFYQYNELSIQYKGLINKKDGGKKE